MDRITKERRSWNMSRIRSTNTAPEMLVRKFLYAHGIRYRIHAKLPGKPDVVIRKRKLAIFINGCFWHAHTNCQNFRWPQTSNAYWREKIEGNIARDVRNYSELEANGWKVLILWECQIKKYRDTVLHNALEACRK